VCASTLSYGRAPNGILGYDEQVDLAILFVQSAEHQPLAFLRLADSRSVQEGQHILVIGNPEGLYGSISDGIISSIRHYPKNWLQITAPISPGSSGSPVMNDQGGVVGVVKAFWIEGQNLNIAIPADQIERVAHEGGACPVINDYSDPNNERGTTPPMVQQQPKPAPVVVATPTPWEAPLADQAEYYYNLAKREDAAGNYRSAISNYTKAIRLGSGKISTYYYCARGLSYASIEQYRKAISDFNEAIRLDPDAALVYECRAIVYDAIGDDVKAAQNMRKARELKKNK
jgi:hypothetical protein